MNKADVIRPFWVGCDYTKCDYTGKIVIDNPPFSILKKIVAYYVENNIRFILFAPTDTIFNPLFVNNKITSYYGHTIKYLSGLAVHTSFITNIDSRNCFVISDHKLLESLNFKKTTRRFGKDYVDETYTSTYLINKYVVRHIDFTFSYDDIDRWVHGKNAGHYGVVVYFNENGIYKHKSIIDKMNVGNF